MKIALKDIRPNPYRDLKHNPLKQDKIAELIESINETGFWENIEVRAAADGKGYEMAYGHHRKAAAEAAGITEANFIVRKMSNTLMLKKMARENSETYGSNDVLSTLELIEATIHGYSEGTLDNAEALKPVEGERARSDSWRYAPSFAPGNQSISENGLPYTALTVAKYLGFATKNERGDMQAALKVLAALNALELIERGEFTYKQAAESDTITDLYKHTRILLSARKNRLDKEKADAERKQADLAKAKANRENAEADAKRAREEGEVIKTRLAFLQAERKAAEEASEKRRTARLLAEATRLREEVAKETELLSRKAAREQELTEKIKLAKKEEQAAKKEADGSDAELERKRVQQEARAYEQFITWSQTLRDKLDTFLSTESDIYATLNQWVRDPRVTEELRGLLQLSLRDLSARAANFNPFPVKPASAAKDKK